MEEKDSKNQKKSNQDPTKIQFKEFFEKTYYNGKACSNNFLIFESYKKEPILVYPTNSFSINFIMINSKSLIRSLKGHKSEINCVKFFESKFDESRFIISCSTDKSIRIWDITTENFKEYAIENVYETHLIFSCSLIFIDKSTTYAISSSCDNSFMKVFDFNGNLIKQIGSDKDLTLYIDVWYDPVLNENCIIDGNFVDIKFYGFSNNSLIRVFKGEPVGYHYSCIIWEFNKKHFLIESASGWLRVWDLYNVEIIKAIFCGEKIHFKGMVQWDDQYIFTSGNDEIKIFDIKNEVCVKSVTGVHEKNIGTLVKFYYSENEFCLVSGGVDKFLACWNFTK